MRTRSKNPIVSDQLDVIVIKRVLYNFISLTRTTRLANALAVKKSNKSANWSVNLYS